MDQDAFRQLLQGSKGSGSSGFSASRNVFAKKGSSSKVPTVSASEPAFKPRKVKKNDAKYRDRASERRDGADGDYAQVEAVLEDFEKRNANGKNRAALEEERKYLGGDGEHTVLVKGLDFALLEQNKAREAAAANEDDDDLLDQALQGVIPTTEPSTSESGSKKRTREDLIRQLKQKRGAGGEGEDTGKDDVQAMEEAKKQGKFKPIGFKPIGISNEPTKKKKKVKDGEKDGERKKKRRKVVEEAPSEALKKVDEMAQSIPPSVKTTGSQQKPQEPEPEPLPEEFDIFAGVGEYEGLGDDDDDDNNGGDRDETSAQARLRRSATPEDVSAVPPRRWIETEEPGEIEESKPSLLSSILKSKFEAKSEEPSGSTDVVMSSRQDDEDGMDEDMERDKPIRLQPLEGSGPSVRELLDMDKAAGKKWKKKDKKKGGAKAEAEEDSTKKQSTKAKVERDYQRLKNYTDSKQEK